MKCPARGEECIRTPPQEDIVRRTLTLLVAAAVLGSLPAVPGRATPIDPSSGMWAEIRRTQYGIPHILAHDWTGLGYGTGYAFAQDNICTIADTYVTVDAERSRF